MSKFQFKQHPFRLIFLLYGVFIVLFSLLYSMPTSREHTIPFIDILFLSTSAMSVTGLSIIDISHDLSRVGQWILFFQIQLGGIGIMAVFGSMVLFFKRNVSLPYQTLMSFDQNQKGLKSIGKLMIFIFLLTVITELIGFLLLLPFVLPHYKDVSEGLFVTLFHAGASFTNAGFDLFDGSLGYYATQPFFIVITCILILIGVLGFPVLFELLSPKHKKFTLYTKVNLSVHSILLVVGFLIFLSVDLLWMDDEFSLIHRFTNALFLSFTSRSAGIGLLDLNLLSFPVLLIIMLLMFIGGSPSSCGGGIRTTTFVVVWMKIRSIIQGKSDVHLFKKSLYEEDVNKALLIFFSYIGMFFISLFTLSIVEDVGIKALAFEIMSALTTTGLSIGITAELTMFSKIWLMALMLIGRIGFIVFIYSFLDTKPSSIKYSKESIIVG